jgi:hypothetical protein
MTDLYALGRLSGFLQAGTDDDVKVFSDKDTITVMWHHPDGRLTERSVDKLNLKVFGADGLARKMRGE